MDGTAGESAHGYAGAMAALARLVIHIGLRKTGTTFSSTASKPIVPRWRPAG